MVVRALVLLVACALLAVRASSCANRSCTDCFDAHAACVWCFDATHPRYDPTGALVGACTDVASAPAPGMGRCFAGSSARCSCRSLITLSVAACTSCEEDGCVWCGLSSWRSVGFCVDSFGSASCPTNSSLVMPVDSCPVPALATWLSVLITIGLAGMFSGVSLLFTLLQKKRYEAFQQAEALGLVSAELYDSQSGSLVDVGEADGETRPLLGQPLMVTDGPVAETVAASPPPVVMDAWRT